MASSSSVHVQLTVITWPRDAKQREELLAKSVPHLLLVEEGASPPDDPHPLEDWLRLPAPPGELEARLAAMRRRTSVQNAVAAPPVLSDDGILRTGQGWVALSPGEQQIVARLIGHFGELTPLAELEGDGAGDGVGEPTRAFRVRVLRLRRKIEPIGLKVVTLRRLGYVLDHE